MKFAWNQAFERAIFILFNVLVITVPFFFFWANEELFEFNKMLLTYGLTLLILAAWLGRMVIEKKVIFRRTAFDIPIIIFLVSQILATIFSIHPYTSFFGYYTRFHGGLLSTITYTVLFYAFVSNVSKRQLPVFFVSMFVAAIGVSLYAIPEHFGYSPSCLIINENHAFDVACWIQKVQDRVFGTFGQPNWLAAYAITLIPWAVASIGWSFTAPSLPTTTIPYRRVLRWLGGIASILLFATLLYTKSRSGLLGFVLGALLLSAGGLWLLYQQHKTTDRFALRSVALWLIAIGFIWVTLFVSSGDALVTTITAKIGLAQPAPTPAVAALTEEVAPVNRLEVGITDSGDIRKIVWQGAVDIWKRYPVFGSGVETFAYSYYQDRPVSHNLVSEWDFLYNKAHNEFLNFLATTGTVGVVAYSLLIAWIVFIGIRGMYQVVRKNDVATGWIMLGLTSGVIALTVSNFFGFSTVMVTILLFLTPALMTLLLKNEDETATPPLVMTPNTSQWLLLGGISLGAVYCLFMIWSWWRADYHYAQGKSYFNSGYYSEGITLVQQAILESPNEALFYDELAVQYSQLAGGLAQQGDATNAAQLAQAAATTSDKVMELNNRHLNFYKSRGRVFINLSILDPAYMEQAKAALEAALNLAPTDAKLMYNLALVEMAMDQPKEAQARLEETIAAKSNYGAARTELARLYRDQGNYPAAIAQYQYILSSIVPNDPDTVQALAETEQEQATRSAAPRN